MFHAIIFCTKRHQNLVPLLMDFPEGYLYHLDLYKPIDITSLLKNHLIIDAVCLFQDKSVI